MVDRENVVTSNDPDYNKEDDEIIAPSQSQLFGPNIACIGSSDGFGLSHRVWG